eukprot:scaffold17811_cov225-Amphora_coffeaeformis.AAC.1
MFCTQSTHVSGRPYFAFPSLLIRWGVTRYNQISYCEREPCERYISRVSFKQRCANIRSQIRSQFGVRNRGAHVSEFATEVHNRGAQQRCARLGENIYPARLFYYGTKRTKTTCVSKTMRWTALSADVCRFKSLHGHSVLRPPYKSCATSLNCATYQRTCVAELQGRIYNHLHHLFTFIKSKPALISPPEVSVYWKHKAGKSLSQAPFWRHPLKELNGEADLFTFVDILDHEGPLRPTDSNYKGSSYNVKMLWNDGSNTWEPLSIIMATDPVTLAGLLDTPGWKKLKKYARRAK